MKPREMRWWENASPDEIHHRQDKLLTRLLRDRIVPFTAHYGKVFNDHHIDARDIHGTDDLELLPFTSKKDLDSSRDFLIIPDQEALKRQWGSMKLFLTRGKARARKILEEELRPIFLTSTTGRSSSPVPFLYTQHDLNNLVVSGRRLMELCSSNPSWRHVNAFPFAPHLAFWQAHYAGIGFNTFTLSTGGGKTLGTDGNIRVIDKIDPHAIISMPTFLYHLLQEGIAKGSKWSNLKRLVLGGEKVPAGMRRKLRSLCHEMGARDVSIMSTYGFTESKMSWSECMSPEGEDPSGFHTYPDMAFIEVIDPKSGKRVPHGQPGEIVFTPLDSRGTVVIRYRTGDMIEHGITHEKCPHCGRTCPRLQGKISRVSDIRELNIDKLKGTLVDFNRLEYLLDDTDGLGSWQIEIRKRNDDPLDSDIIIVHAVALNSDTELLQNRIHERFHEATEFSPNAIEFHSWSEMRKMQGVGEKLKEQKVADHRPSSG